MKPRFHVRLIVMLTTAVLLSGCGPHYLDALGLKDETLNEPTYPDDNPAPRKTNGTIYQAGYEMEMYPDHLASRVGDVLTVRLEEVTIGQKKAKTRANKDSDYSLGIPDIENSNSTGASVTPHQIVTNTSIHFNGDGEADEQNQLHGTITVTVRRVLTNNNLVISGESWLTINDGREYVRLTGIVRREDIEPNNVISSTRIADARIAYSGGGQVGNNSRIGWFGEFLLKFFPY